MVGILVRLALRFGAARVAPGKVMRRDLVVGLRRVPERTLGVGRHRTERLAGALVARWPLVCGLIGSCELVTAALGWRVAPVHRIVAVVVADRTSPLIRGLSFVWHVLRRTRPALVPARRSCAGPGSAATSARKHAKALPRRIGLCRVLA